ncbi:MAG: OmpA family protein [Bacteroidales bacterium]|nr:OmpA family protein [Bacteroidales bacterium]
MKYKKIILLVSFCFISKLKVFAQEDTVKIPEFIDIGKAEITLNPVLWASKVIDFSSEYSSTIKSAKQILGKPSVLPGSGKSPCAWTYKKQAKDGKEFIKVGFDHPIRPRQVAVAENYKPGAIEKIILYGKNNNQYIVVYENEAKLLNLSSRMLNVFFTEPQFDVYYLELQLNSKKVSEFEIDAVAISTLTDTIKANINIPPGLKYKSQKESLGPSINTEYDERAPIISADGTELYFVRKNHPNNACGRTDEDDIWYSKYTENGWLPAINLGPPLNNCCDNFVQSVSPDGNMLLLANKYRKEGKNVLCEKGVSVAYKTFSGWSFPEEQKIKDFYNYSEFVNYFLAPNNKYLLIAMQGDDSYGNLDLYVSFRLSENTWSKPLNLGPTVNTAANDFSPFLAADGITLYYSTSGLPGFGNEDIFVTRRLDDTWQKWTEPINLGPPINSKGSDTKFSIPAAGNYAYFTSTEGSVGLNDIFKILLPDTLKPIAVALLKGKIIDFQSKKPIGGAIIIYKNYPSEAIVVKEVSDSLTGKFKVYLPTGYLYTVIIKANGYIDGKQTLDLTSIHDYTEIEQKPIELISRSAYKTLKGKVFDKLTDKAIVGAKVVLMTDTLSKKVLAMTYTNEKGEFEIRLENVADVERAVLIIEKNEYQSSTFEISDFASEINFNYDLKIEPEIKKDKVIQFHNIYFDYGKADITDTAAVILDRIYDVLVEYPNMVIELSGHTDSQSSFGFNMKLSQARADNARSYLIKKGIDPKRIIAKGYGETKLLNHCKDGVTCSPEEHAINRRIEVKILKM